MSKEKLFVMGIGRLADVQHRDDGTTAILAMTPDDRKWGLILTEAAASELNGALMERPAHGENPEDPYGRRTDVEIQELPPGSEADMTVRLWSETGQLLALNLDLRTARRFRDMLSDQIARHRRGKSH